MTKRYAIQTNDGQYYHEWFTRSYNAIIYLCPSEQSVTDFYQEHYGVKLVILADPVITHIEFEDEETALMFIMRWS